MQKLLIIKKIKIFFLFNIIKRKERKRYKKNKTPLHYAAMGNSLCIGDLLISKGANINAKTKEGSYNFGDKGSKTPLHYAAEKNSTEIGELLISKGADINAKDMFYLNILILFLNKIN